MVDLTWTREEWLRKLVEVFREWFKDAGHPVPGKLRASCGWPSHRALSRRQRTIGQCWYSPSSADGTNEVFISPVLGDGVEVGHVLVHELCHAVVGPGVGHKGEFVKLIRKMGLIGKPTATTAGPELLQRLHDALKGLPPYPHAALSPTGGPVKKQPTRMLKLVCPEDGYMVRTTLKWISVGLPTCPSGHHMEEV